MTIEELKDFDNFYYYGQGNLEMETKSDIHQIVNQNNRSMFYNRDKDSAGIDAYENTPNTIIQSILIPYNIVSALSKRNTYVGNGQENTKDRRIAISQNSIKIKSDRNSIVISIFYVALININSIQNTTIALTQ